ncbi:MAG TPA: hypothetical protein VGX23_31170 [Actinocrinis sp.]|nr:hypothetical protein [Actinocrinis sp.]
MSEPVMVGRQLDAELDQIVRLFRRRRKWRHILALLAGVLLLPAGSAIVAARVTRHTMSDTPSIGVGAGVYAAGVLLFAWGAAAGFTARLARWFPATVVLGVLAVFAFGLAALFSNETDEVFANGRGQAGTSFQPSPGHRSATAPGIRELSGRVLAAELLSRDEVARFLGPAPAEVQTPGEHVVRARSLAIWRTGPDVRPRSPAGGGAADARPSVSARVAQTSILSLTVQHSARAAGRLRQGRFPGSGQALPGLPGGYVRRRAVSSAMVTRVRAGRGEWVVALQLRSARADDPTPLLASTVARLVDLLDAASAT